MTQTFSKSSSIKAIFLVKDSIFLRNSIGDRGKNPFSSVQNLGVSKIIIHFYLYKAGTVSKKILYIHSMKLRGRNLLSPLWNDRNGNWTEDTLGKWNRLISPSQDITTFVFLFFTLRSLLTAWHLKAITQVAPWQNLQFCSLPIMLCLFFWNNPILYYSKYKNFNCQWIAYPTVLGKCSGLKSCIYVTWKDIKAFRSYRLFVKLNECVLETISLIYIDKINITSKYI